MSNWSVWVIHTQRFEIRTDIFILTEQMYYTRRMWRKKSTTQKCWGHLDFFSYGLSLSLSLSLSLHSEEW